MFAVSDPITLPGIYDYKVITVLGAYIAHTSGTSLIRTPRDRRKCPD